MAIYDIIPTKKEQNSKQVNKGIKDLSLFDSAVRPLLDDHTISNKTKALGYLGAFGFNQITLFDIYALSRYADILQLIFNAKDREIFRNGIDYEPLYDEISEEQYKRYERVLRKANDNGQALIEVLQEFNKDLEVFDDAYLLCTKDYLFNEENKIVGGEVKEILRIDPLSVEMMLDSSQRLGRFENGETAYVSLTNRGEVTTDQIDKKTGKQNIIAHYRVTTAKGYMYYNNTEILHKSAYNPSITYGYSPLFTLYNKVLILLGQDHYIKQYYTQDKPIKGFLAFNTNNWEGLKKVLDQIDAEKKRYPHKVFPIPFNTPDNRKPVEYIDMSKTLQEMQFTESRNELRNQIGAMYGVSPIFQNDMSTSGGLNNEGLQITVTNRAIEDRQTLINEHVFPFIFQDNLGISTFKVFLRPSEEQDDMHEEELEAKRIANAKAKLELGLKGVMDDEGKFIFTEGDLELKQTQPEGFNPFQVTESAGDVSVMTPVNVAKAEYQGRNVTLYKPFRINDDEKQYGVYVKTEADNVKLLKFGSAEMRNNRDDPKARKSFRARFNCDTAKDKNSARYWACRLWTSTPLDEVLSPKSEVEGEKIEKELGVVKKENPIPTKEQNKFKTNLEKELDKLLNKLNFKQKPSEEEISKVVEEVVSNLEKQLKIKSANRVKTIYNQAKNKVEQQLDTKLSLTSTDKNAIEALKRNPNITSAITNLSNDLKKKAFDIIENAYKNPTEFTIDKITDNLKKELDFGHSRLRMIARTETSKISAAARKNSYDQTGKEYKYFHIGPDDNRTSKISQELKELTKEGVSWGEYLTLMKRVVEKYNPKWRVEEANPISHPNSRHIFIARPVRE